MKIDFLAKAIAHAEAISFPKWSVWIKNENYQKHAKNHSRRLLELFYAKNRLKKYPILEKSDNFENRLSCKGYGPCKGSSLHKLVRLGQKIKVPKTCKKTFYKIIRVAFAKKHIFEKRNNFKNLLSSKGFSPCKGYSLYKMATLGQKLKMPKTCNKTFYKIIRVLLCKNR